MTTQIDLREQFANGSDGESIRTQSLVRSRWVRKGIEAILDSFKEGAAQCLFLRVIEPEEEAVSIRLLGDYRLQSCKLGGWLLISHDEETVYWVPKPPCLRALDEHKRIVSETVASISEFEAASNATCVTFRCQGAQTFDAVIWRFSRDSGVFLDELNNSSTLETQHYFIYASHSICAQPADFYAHIVHGHVYETLWAWPKRKKICDELDAYALYLVAAGLGHATGKTIYQLLRQQVVVSVLSRQERDGGFRHGEWTDLYESHNRLVNGAVQLLAAEMERTGDPVLASALSNAAAFLSRQVDNTDAGTWFLHDSLEVSEEAMRHYPLSWIASTWLGKSPTNLLILNTHMDCMLALHRYQKLSGETRYDDLLRSAHAATQRILGEQPADWIYKPLMWAVRLTLLPRGEQAALPLPLRALKRLVWKHLLPHWHWIRTRFPRFVMPDGYIERSLGQEGFVHRYHGVHLMDMSRYLRHYSDPQLEAALAGMVDFGMRSRLTQYWKERPDSRDSLGFWTEGLFQLCTQSRHKAYRRMLAAAVVDLTDAGLGMPPSLLGANSEIVAPDQAIPCPSPADQRIRIVNLSTDRTPEFLAVNPSPEPLSLAFECNAPEGVVWRLPETGQPARAIPARGWLVGGID